MAGNRAVLDTEAHAVRTGAPWWLSALVVLAIAAWAADPGGTSSSGPRWVRADLYAVLTVFASAVLYRLWAIGTYPPADAFGFEEFQTGGLAYSTLQDWWSFTLEFPLTNLLPAISFRLFGFSGLALRVPFLVSGVAAPIFLYLALRRIVVRPAAWAGAMLLASNRWAALAARFADEIFFPVSLVAIAAWLLVVALQDRRHRSTFALALVTSDFFYAYSGYRGLPVIALASAALLAGMQLRRGPRGQRLLGHFVLVGAVWVVMLSPGVTNARSAGESLFLEAIHRHEAAWGSERSLHDRALETVHRLRQGWKVFALEGDEWSTLNIPNEPMFDPVTAALGTLAVVVALRRFRNPSRGVPLTTVAVLFLALALIPVNFNVSRYFVLLVPLFFLMGCLMDDLLGWIGRPGVAVIGAVVMLVAGLNMRNVLRVINSPVVKAGFQSGENTVLAAIRAVPAGSDVVLLTVDGSNALEPSDYRWFTARLHGGRPDSLTAAFSLPAESDEPVYWVTEGYPEVQLLPKLVASACNGAASKIIDAPLPDAVVGVSWIDSRAGCHAPPAQGLRGVYRVDVGAVGSQETRQVDPALCAYTIPWPLAWKLQDRQIQGLRVEWDGRVTGMRPGDYGFRIEVRGARVQLRVGQAETRVVSPAEQWASAHVLVRMDSDPLGLNVRLDAEPGVNPRVRLYWTPPDAPEEIVPPGQLQPAA